VGIDRGRTVARRLSWSRRGRLLLVGLAAAWLAAGVRRFPAAEQFGVLDGALSAGRALRLESGWSVAPPGLLRLTTYPRGAADLPLPAAADLAPSGAEAGRAAPAGWATLQVRPERWRELHRASAGRGLRGALLAAVRAALAGLESSVPPAGEEAWRARFEALLATALEQSGLELRGLRLESVAAAAATGEGEPALADRRLLVLGLDGADWRILDGLFEQDKLPHLRGLVERGVRARLLSIQPLISPVVWTTIATGVEPTRHGVLDFLVQDEDGARQPVTAAQRLVPTVWEILSRAGVDVGVVGWWATWPAEPVRGYLVADRVSYQLFAYRSDPADARGKTWPPRLYDEIRPLLVEPTAVSWETVRSYLSGPRQAEQEFDRDERHRLDEFRTLLASGQSYLEIARQLRAGFRPRLEIVYFEGTDTVGHLFMPFRPPALPGVPAATAASFGSIVDRYYETVDGYIGRLLEQREGWTVAVVSDHGFASDETRPRTTDSRIGHGAAADWHRRFGVLILSGAGMRRNVTIEEATIYDVAPTVLALFGQPIPRSWNGRVLTEALTEGFVAAHPPRYRADDPERAPRGETVSDPAAADLIAKLRSLGYVGGGEDGGDSRTARNNAGVSLLAQGRYAEAENELRAALGGSSEMPMLLVNLGLALRMQRRPDEAREVLEDAFRHRETRRIAGNLLAQLRLDASEPAEAERLARELLVEEPTAAMLRNTLGLALEAQGELGPAAVEYERAAGLDPDSALAPNNLGNLAKRRQDLDAAERWYLRAIEADPYFMGSYNNLALVHQARGEAERALDLYERALAKAPGNAIVLNNIGSLHFSARDFESARRSWNAAARADERYPSPLNNLAGLEIAQGRLDAAVPLLERALALDPGYGDARINLATVHRKRGDAARARAELERAAQDPRAAGSAWKHLGFLDLAAGRLEAGAAALERALSAAPRDRDVLNGLGEALRLQGHRARAAELWRRSLELDGTQTRVRQELARLEAEAGG